MVTAQPTQTKTSVAPVAAGKVVDARLSFLRMSPRKIRLVAAAVIGMDAPAAVDYLKLVNKLPSRPLAKLIASAMANGEHNFGARKDNLYIKRILVNQGPTLKRWQPKAYGRAGVIRKRSAHIIVELAERVPTAGKAPKTVTATETPTAVVAAPKASVKASDAKGSGKSTSSSGTKRDSGGRPRAFFNRKTG